MASLKNERVSLEGGAECVRGGGVPRGVFRLQGWWSLTSGAGDTEAILGWGTNEQLKKGPAMPCPRQVQRRVPRGKVGACWGPDPHIAVPQLRYVREEASGSAQMGVGLHLALDQWTWGAAEPAGGEDRRVPGGLSGGTRLQEAGVMGQIQRGPQPSRNLVNVCPSLECTVLSSLRLGSGICNVG